MYVRKIGSPMDRFIEDFFSLPNGNTGVQRYPLTNIATDENMNLYIEIAVAGFSKEDISMELKGNKLHITGVYSEKDDLVSLRYYQQNISQRDFNRVIALDERYLQGDINASIEDGILSVIISPIEPDKKLIEIK